MWDILKMSKANRLWILTSKCNVRASFQVRLHSIAYWIYVVILLWWTRAKNCSMEAVYGLKPHVETLSWSAIAQKACLLSLSTLIRTTRTRQGLFEHLIRLAIVVVDKCIKCGALRKAQSVLMFAHHYQNQDKARVVWASCWSGCCCCCRHVYQVWFFLRGAKCTHARTPLSKPGQGKGCLRIILGWLVLL